MSLKLHRKLWGWLYLNPGKAKKDWPEWNTIENLPVCLCFACDAALKRSKISHYKRYKCENCPLVWNSKGDTSPYYNDYPDNLFTQWASYTAEYNYAKNPIMQYYYRLRIRMLAKKIRDLPVHESWKSDKDWSEESLEPQDEK